MPVARSRRASDRVDYVVVKRSGVDGEEEVVDVKAVKTIPIEAIIRRQYNTPTFNLDTVSEAELSDDSDESSDDDSGDESDDDDESPIVPIRTGTGEPSFTITLTESLAQETGQALANTDPSETSVNFNGPPPPPPPPPREKGGISQTTEHLLIAAGSVGATIIIVMIIMGIYTMRKRGLSFSEASRQLKNKLMGRRPAPPPKQADNWQDSKAGYMEDYGSMRKQSITPPQATAAIPRSGSISSQRPVMAMQRSDSFKQDVERRAQSSFLLDSPPPGRNNSHRRKPSNTPSSPVLPLQTGRQSVSTHNTRSMSEGSELKYPDPVPERSLSPLPPPPTFKQFLAGRPSATQKNSGFGNMVSRFSWTNSNAPQTPHEIRDTNSHNLGRDSFMTQRSSVPRFRTVDSWVNQQANRVEAQKLKEQFRLTTTSTVYSSDDESAVPSVPAIPRSMAQPSLPTIPHSRPLSSPPSPLPLQPLSGGLPGKNVRHERHDTRTTVDTAPIFRQHPGTEVRFSTRSVVPSEILDMGPRPNVLS